MTICGPTMATNVALMTIIGGSATILGPTIGAALVFPLSEILRSNLGDKLSGMHLFIYGVLLIVMIIYMPKGVISILGILRKKCEAMASLWGATSVDYIVDQADYVKEVLGKDISELKVAIIHEDGSYGTAVGQGNNARALEAGMNVVVYEPYSSSTLDLSSVIMKLIAADPDVLLLTGYVNDGSLFLKQSQELGFTVPILVTHSGGHSVQAFVDAIGDQVNYLLTVDPVACNPKLDSFSADLQAAFKDFEARWTEKYGVAPAHHVEMRAFAQSYLFFTEVAPKAIEEGGDFTAETVRDAILSLELDASKNLMGSDVKFPTVDEPFTDPAQGNQPVGQNIHAGAFINQYFDGELYCVWPEAYAQKEGVLFLPASSTLSAGVAG